jgi:DNA-binding response OmpR family regulator
MPGLALILDDDRDTTEMLQLALQLAGYTAEVANDFEQAFKRIKASKHCAFFMDYNIPRMDPRSFVEDVRKLRDDLPIFIVSGRHDLHERAREVGAEGCIQKPFGIDEIVSVIQKHCDA